ncbi:hypothetical protein RB195_002788 [Necator americanus]
MYMQVHWILLCALVVCCSSNLFIGRISTRPSAGKRGVADETHRLVQGDRPESICSSASLESTLERMNVLRAELQRLSTYVAVCDVRTV